MLQACCCLQHWLLSQAQPLKALLHLAVVLLLLLFCRLTLELRDRQQKVEVLATKFETLTSKNRATDPDGGEPKSQAYYIIKVT